jgi:predicted Holliday junction resolvase-like endonuclease
MDPSLVIIAVMVLLVLVFAIGYLIGKTNAQKREAASRQQARSVMKGQIAEHLAPFLPGFPEDLKASEARFVGKPVDFLVFKGIDEQNITEVVFVEVKTGNAQLSSNERQIRNAINEKRVRWQEYRFPPSEGA